MKDWQYPFDPNFRFDVAQFRDLVCEAPVVPPHGETRMTIDPAYFANEDSDMSAIVASFMEDVEEARVLTVLDATCGRWRGLSLPDRVVAMADKWKPAQIHIESNGNGRPHCWKTSSTFAPRRKASRWAHISVSSEQQGGGQAMSNL